MTRPDLVRRAGRTHAVVVLSDVEGPLEGAIVDDGRPVEVDPSLLEAGRSHLDRVLARSPATWNGPLLAMRSVDGGVVTAGRSDYFTMLATADALIAEDPLDTTGRPRPMRDRVAALAGGDPCRRGDGRASVVGVTMLLVVEHDGGGVLLLGRRRDDLAVSPGLLATVDGCAEAADGDVLVENARRELHEEAPALAARVEAAGGLGARARLLGITSNLLRFTPSLCIEVRIPAGADDQIPSLDAAEFGESVLVPATSAGLAALWSGELGSISPPAAGALALWEGHRPGGYLPL